MAQGCREAQSTRRGQEVGSAGTRETYYENADVSGQGQCEVCEARDSQEMRGARGAVSI